MQISSEESKISIKSRYRKDIDGLRAFAVITVIINHFSKDILPGGYFGVDIFFVISGFVITSSLYKRPSKNFKDFISGFYGRRLKRLVPSLSIFVLISSIIICLFDPYPSISLRTGLSSLFGLSNLYLLEQSTDYFAQSTQLNVFTHTWSLGVEEQFYVLFPFLIWFSGFGRHTKNGNRNLFLFLVSLTIASLIGFIYLYSTNQDAAYFLMPTRLWEMSSGCLIFIVFHQSPSIEEYFPKIPPLVLLALIIGVMYIPIAFAAGSTVLIVALTSLLIVSLKKQTLTYKILTNHNVVYLGLISYPLYLWHWSVLSISRWTIGIHWWSVPFQLGIIILLAVASYQFIEKPLRNRTWLGKRWKDTVFGIGVLFMISLCLIVLGRPLKGKLYKGNEYNKWNIGGYGETKIIHNTELPTIYLLGDSHAGHYGALMTKIVEKKNFNFIMHPQGGGLKLLNKNNEEHILAPLREYENRFKKDDIIIFSASIGNYKDDAEFTKTYESFIQKTKKFGMKYILISPTPVFSEVKKGDTCQKEWYRPSWAIDSLCYASLNKKEWFISKNEEISVIENFLVANPRILYIDAFSLLCPDDYCKNYDKGSLLYKDAHHLTSSGAMKLSKSIRNVIQSK